MRYEIDLKKNVFTGTSFCALCVQQITVLDAITTVPNYIVCMPTRRWENMSIGMTDASHEEIKAEDSLQHQKNIYPSMCIILLYNM